MTKKAFGEHCWMQTLLYNMDKLIAAEKSKQACSFVVFGNCAWHVKGSMQDLVPTNNPQLKLS